MFILAEVIDGDVYALDANGRVWRLFGSIAEPTPQMQLVASGFRFDIEAMMRPRLAEFAVK